MKGHMKMWWGVKQYGKRRKEDQDMNECRELNEGAKRANVEMRKSMREVDAVLVSLESTEFWP